MKTIILIHKDKLPKRPPVISSLLALSDLGYKLILITTGINDFWKEEFNGRKIEFHVITPSKLPFPIISKINFYKIFQKKCFQIVEEAFSRNGRGMIWVESVSTMVALGTKLKSFEYILQIQELHEKSKLQQRYIKKLINDAKLVFMPEYNRTLLFKVWYKMTKTPIVLPNKPYYLISEEEAHKILSDYSDILGPLKNKKLILYQGGISRTRMLDKICVAIKRMNSDYHLLLVGPEQTPNIINELRQITKEITHIKFLPAPNHLAFCCISYVGFVFYAPESLNNLYCAPNKIYEYSAYGLPMLGNDIPGLKYTIGINGAGAIVNPENIEDIITGLETIENDYDSFKNNTKQFFNSVNNKEIIRQSLQSIDFYEK